MQCELRWLRALAKSVVVLGLEYGVENKTRSEIQKETDELVKRALLISIHYYDGCYKMGASDTPEGMLQVLWEECYDYELAKGNVKDIEDRTRERFDKELDKVYGYINYEGYRRLYDYELSDEAQP
jgi:hypothetical protein